MNRQKFIAVFIAMTFVLQSVFEVYAFTDNHILTDTPQNIFVGRREGADIIRNIDFTDLPEDHFARPSVMQGGALGLISGYERTFNPSGTVSKQEALTFIVRAIGMERDAVNMAAELQDVMPLDEATRTLWSLGYLYVANTIGLITADDFADAISGNQDTLNAATNFIREAAATREEVAGWVVTALESVDSTLFETSANIQSIYRFSDWENISADKLLAVEALVSNNIMNGNGAMFLPQNSLTRGEMSVLLRNLDSIYFEAMGLDRISGTVGAVQVNQQSQTGSASVWRNFYIRTEDGTVDILQHPYDSSVSPQDLALEVPTYRNGQIAGLLSLEIGDRIDYIVNPETNEVLFVNVVGASTAVDISGRLFEVNVAERTINITDDQGRHFIYPLVLGLLTNEDGVDYIDINGTKTSITSLAYGSKYVLTLRNNIVTSLSYLGEPELYSEIRGIVIENNPDFSYLTIINNEGREMTFRYFSNDILVTKRQHYDTSDSIGYLAHMFPNHMFNPRETVISEIEAGDIVFITTDPENTNVIQSISAATNYIMHYGKIMQITNDGNTVQILVQYENNQTSWFTVPTTIPLSKDGNRMGIGALQVGDWLRLLVNQAIIAPGHVMESVKEIVAEGDERFISNIVRGQLAGINNIQNNLMLQNVQTLSIAGWSDYRNLEQFSLDGNHIEFFNGSQRVSVDYALNYLTRASGEVYVALENHFTGERIRRVTFRDSRDQLLDSSTVTFADGAGNFTTLAVEGMIATDNGTIVRRHGRLVDGQNIMPSDFARVVLNGAGTAAVVDIVDAPDTSGIMIIRGRVLSVDDGVSFTVQSMSALSGLNWNFTPIQRVFSIDYNTLFLNQNGFVDPNTFLSYSDTSVVDDVYNIVVDGSHAIRVIDAPYANHAVRGTIYAIDGNTVSLRDAQYYDRDANIWRVVSNTNSVITVETGSNTIIARNNELLNNASGLQVGEQLRVMTNSLPNNITSGITVTGYIVFVER